jgi:hypothetical protein
MEYKLSSFGFSKNLEREDKNHAIMRINSIRSKCPSDSRFTGDFDLSNNLYFGEIKVLFSKGTFLVKQSGSNMSELMGLLLIQLDEQIAIWKEVRFDQPETFINYYEWNKKNSATGS